MMVKFGKDGKCMEIRIPLRLRLKKKELPGILLLILVIVVAIASMPLYLLWNQKDSIDFYVIVDQPETVSLENYVLGNFKGSGSSLSIHVHPFMVIDPQGKVLGYLPLRQEPGRSTINESRRQMCIQRMYPGYFAEYLMCRNHNISDESLMHGCLLPEMKEGIDMCEGRGGRMWFSIENQDNYAYMQKGKPFPRIEVNGDVMGISSPESLLRGICLSLRREYPSCPR